MTQFLRPGPVAEKLGVSLQTLRDWANAGKIPVYRPSGPRGPMLFDPREVEAFIRSRKSAGQTTETVAT